MWRERSGRSLREQDRLTNIWKGDATVETFMGLSQGMLTVSGTRGWL